MESEFEPEKIEGESELIDFGEIYELDRYGNDRVGAFWRDIYSERINQQITMNRLEFYNITQDILDEEDFLNASYAEIVRLLPENCYVCGLSVFQNISSSIGNENFDTVFFEPIEVFIVAKSDSEFREKYREILKTIDSFEFFDDIITRFMKNCTILQFNFGMGRPRIVIYHRRYDSVGQIFCSIDIPTYECLTDGGQVWGTKGFMTSFFSTSIPVYHKSEHKTYYKRLLFAVEEFDYRPILIDLYKTEDMVYQIQNDEISTVLPYPCFGFEYLISPEAMFDINFLCLKWDKNPINAVMAGKFEEIDDDVIEESSFKYLRVMSKLNFISAQKTLELFNERPRLRVRKIKLMLEDFTEYVKKLEEGMKKLIIEQPSCKILGVSESKSAKEFLEELLDREIDEKRVIPISGVRSGSAKRRNVRPFVNLF